MDKEMNLLLPHVADVSTVTANGFEFHTGLMAGHKVVACKCGIGKVNAAVGTLTLIDTFHPDMVVNTGVAGGTGAGTPPAQVLDLVLASEVAYHDVWCGPGTVRGQAAGLGRHICGRPCRPAPYSRALSRCRGGGYGVGCDSAGVRAQVRAIRVPAGGKRYSRS